MGADIHIFTEVKKEGKWQKVKNIKFSDSHSPFDWRSYGMFGFLADVRNYSHVPPLGECKGLPIDSEYLNTVNSEDSNSLFSSNTSLREEILSDYDYHSHTYYTLKELIDFDYDQKFEDLRYTETKKLPNGAIISNGASVATPGNGNIVSYREFLGEEFFDDIKTLCTLGDPEDVRVVFWFDN